MSDREKLSTEPYKGVRDFYPEDWSRLSSVFCTVREVLVRKGYQEYQASPLEPSELYESKGNEEIISEQTFTFEDRGGRRVTLRPEMTPTLARMVAHKRRELAFPLRWFSIGNRFRYERPQRGRLREFYQCDVDFVGAPEGESDLEVVALADEVLKSFGALEQDFVIRINSRKLLKAASAAAGHDAETSRKYLRLLDRKEKISKADYQAELLTLGGTDPLDIIQNAVGDDIANERERIQSVVAELVTRGVGSARFDPTLTRGFDYYTGIVFEIFDTNPKNPRALFGGGRYDELVTLFGGDPIPAVGFAIGDVTLLDFLETHNLLKDAASAPRLQIIPVSPGDVSEARKFQNLYVKDVSSTLSIMGKSVGDQVKEADRRKTPFVVVLGRDEFSSPDVTIKNLVTGEEKKVLKDEVAKYLRDTEI